jgi:hypothetical protein
VRFGFCLFFFSASTVSSQVESFQWFDDLALIQARRRIEGESATPVIARFHALYDEYILASLCTEPR